MENLFMLLQSARSGDPAQTNFWVMTIFMIFFIAFFYLVVIRPQNKKRKELENMLNNLKKNDKVVTIGGIHGKVVSTKDNEVVLRVSDNTEITFEKSAIARVVDAQKSIEKKNDKDNKDKEVKGNKENNEINENK